MLKFKDRRGAQSNFGVDNNAGAGLHSKNASKSTVNIRKGQLYSVGGFGSGGAVKVDHANGFTNPVSSISNYGGAGGQETVNAKQTTVRIRGKRYDQVQTSKASINQGLDEQKKREERRKMIRRSNERLRMLDEMGKQRQIKLHQDLERLEAEKEAERMRQQRLTAKRIDFGQTGFKDKQAASPGIDSADNYQLKLQARQTRSPQRSHLASGNSDQNSFTLNRRSLQDFSEA